MEVLFPYEEVRDSQDKLIESVFECVKEGKNLIAHAPTGLGKTSAAIAAALPHVLATKGTLIFVTPRHTQHVLAVNTLREIKEKHNLDFAVVDLVGKRNMCALGGIQALASGEFADYCRQLIEKKKCDYYTSTYSKGKPSVKAKKALDELKSSALHTEEFKATCSNQNLCPYEMACLVGKKARVIVADYFHILNSKIKESIFKKMEKTDSEVVLIIDEAHNLLDRTRDLMSTKISTFSLERCRKEASQVKIKEVVEGIQIIKDALERLAKNKIKFEDSESLITKKEFYDLLDMDLVFFTDGLREAAKKIYEFKKGSSCGALADFLDGWGGPDDAHVRIISKGFLDRGSYISLDYRCLDSSLILSPLSKELHSIIMMSGTLSPAITYRDLFGVDAICKEYPNPFPVKNKLTLIVPETTTKFTARSENMFKLISKKCAEVVNNVPGNSIVFFPSYALRDKVYAYLRSDSEKTVFLESARMDKEERGHMLDKFKAYKNSGAVLLGVAAGSFGEGIDLIGDALKAVVVVGLPLARPDLETKELINYYDRKFSKGWHYGYTLPAFVKCWQNAGRCIRSETDRGIVVFLDERYTWDNYFNLFPKGEYLRVSKEPVERIKEFFA